MYRQMRAGLAFLGLLVNAAWVYLMIGAEGTKWPLIPLLPAITYIIGALITRGERKIPEETEVPTYASAPVGKSIEVASVESEVLDVLAQLAYKSTEAKRLYREAVSAHPELDSEAIVQAILLKRGRIVRKEK